MIVSFILKKKNNNLDFFRLILALMVIIGHSPILNGSSNFWVDPITVFFNFTDSGSLAVKIFFFISGLVVTNSLIINKKPYQFLISRFFRIIPAYIIVLCSTVFVIGPLVTSLSMTDYFNSEQILIYIKNNILLNIMYELPGVFISNPYPRTVNGSIWTLSYEIGCYIVLFLVYLILRNKRKLLYNLIILTVIIEGFSPVKILFPWLINNSDINLLPASFAFGCFFAINADVIKIDIFSVIAMVLLYNIFSNSPYAGLIFILMSCIIVLYLSYNPFFKRFNPKYDISFGVYLWGFVIQQTLYHYTGHIYVGLHCLFSVIISMNLAFLTHFLIEKPFIRLGKYLGSLYFNASIN
jgi:peptidoglycan/LPS O-acetylase OafA/YrhL